MTYLETVTDGAEIPWPDELPEDFYDRHGEPHTNGHRAHHDTEDTGTPDNGGRIQSATDTTDFGAIDGGTFIFDEPVDIPAIWGQTTAGSCGPKANPS